MTSDASIFNQLSSIPNCLLSDHSSHLNKLNKSSTAAAAAAAAALENNKCSEVRRTLCICVANLKITRHPEGRLVSESAHE